MLKTGQRHLLATMSNKRSATMSLNSWSAFFFIHLIVLLLITPVIHVLSCLWSFSPYCLLTYYEKINTCKTFETLSHLRAIYLCSLLFVLGCNTIAITLLSVSAFRSVFSICTFFWSLSRHYNFYSMLRVYRYFCKKTTSTKSSFSTTVVESFCDILNLYYSLSW